MKMEEKLNNLRIEILASLKTITLNDLDAFYINYFGAKGSFTLLLRELKDLSKEEKPKIGRLVNEIKSELLAEYERRKLILNQSDKEKWFDITYPGLKPNIGHTHIVSQAIEEITEIFASIGFTRVRYPEVEWDWYSFSSLNFPLDHPARDDFETFFVKSKSHPKFGRMLLSPHTSSGQVREMERAEGKPPIRMINIAKCYRPNWDISHTPMFHQFEGLVVDRGINITHLKGTMDYFARKFFGPNRMTRLRPYHFQFTEPSFEVDINCGVCLGKGRLDDGSKCRLCKEGWLELGGSGMVHPNVLTAGKIDSDKYSGFAFGWGVERTYMMKTGTKLDDIRLLYGNDIRFLEQF
jgi:phenylalanyl-tRNA synthetase alpha chain